MNRPAPNKWRTIRYTDDGCCLYQCLPCKATWEGRSAPGWFSTTVECDPGTPDAHSYTQGDKTHYYVSCEPRYMPEWTYCPYCGIKWEGPIRCDVDNERMLGERRQKAVNAPYESSHPDFYWTVEIKTKYQDWYVNEYIDSRDYGAADVLKFVRKLRQEEWENCQGVETMEPNGFRVGKYKVIKPETHNYISVRRYL